MNPIFGETQLFCLFSLPLLFHRSCRGSFLMQWQFTEEEMMWGLDATAWKQRLSWARTHTSTCKGPLARHLMIDHQPGAIPSVWTSWFLSLVSCVDHCLLVMWLTHPNEVMIHAGVFKQVEVRLESRDSFPGGPAGEGRGSWKLCLRGWRPLVSC